MVAEHSTILFSRNRLYHYQRTRPLTAWALRARVQDGFARAYVYACMAGLAGTLASGMLGDWFLPFVYNIGIAGFRASMLAWFFLGGLVVIRQSVNRQSDDQSAAAH